MSAHAMPSGRSKRLLWTVFLPIFTMACVSLVAIGVLTKAINESYASESQPSSIEAVALAVASDGTAVGPAPAPRGLELLETLGALVKELGKQAIEQPGHFLIAALPILLSRHLTGVPWYGWPMVPLLAYREWLQWPSNRWWDPPLDWAVIALGVIMATWALGALRRPGTGDELAAKPPLRLVRSTPAKLLSHRSGQRVRPA